MLSLKLKNDYAFDERVFVQVQNIKVYWYWYLKANPKINKTTIFRPMFVNYSSTILKIQRRPRLFVSSHLPLFWSPTVHGRVKKHHRKGRENKQMINQMTESFLGFFFFNPEIQMLIILPAFLQFAKGWQGSKAYIVSSKKAYLWESLFISSLSCTLNAFKCL